MCKTSIKSGHGLGKAVNYIRCDFALKQFFVSLQMPQKRLRYVYVYRFRAMS